MAACHASRLLTGTTSFRFDDEETDETNGQVENGFGSEPEVAEDAIVGALKFRSLFSALLLQQRRGDPRHYQTSLVPRPIVYQTTYLS